MGIGDAAFCITKSTAIAKTIAYGLSFGLGFVGSGNSPALSWIAMAISWFAFAMVLKDMYYEKNILRTSSTNSTAFCFSWGTLVLYIVHLGITSYLTISEIAILKDAMKTRDQQRRDAGETEEEIYQTPSTPESAGYDDIRVSTYTNPAWIAQQVVFVAALANIVFSDSKLKSSIVNARIAATRPPAPVTRPFPTA